jgi:magnesium chelatase subunit I
VILPDEVARLGLRLVNHLQIDSLRAEITLFEASRAYAAAEGRLSICADDLSRIAAMSLRLRRSVFITEYLAQQSVEENEIINILDHTFTNGG